MKFFPSIEDEECLEYKMMICLKHLGDEQQDLDECIVSSMFDDQQSLNFEINPL